MGKLTSKELRVDNLKSSDWIGIVEDNSDDLFEGRCKIRVFGKMDQKTDPNDPNSEFILPTTALPWARPSTFYSGGSNSGSGTFSIPKLGTVLRVTFDNGNFYSPVYHESIYPSAELKEEIQNAYQNSHILIYDTGFGLSLENGEVSNSREGEAIKVFFTEERGLVFDYATTEGSSIINIKPNNSIEIRNPNGDTIIMLNDGNITFKHSAKFIIETSDNTEINCNDAIITCKNAKINASAETHINSPKIKLGETAAESIIKGDTFAKIFDNHIHPTGVGPSGPPVTKTAPALSNKNKTD
jgi:hypothetical protein